MASFNLSLISTYLDREAQISFLITKIVKILDKYSDFINVFSPNLTVELTKNTSINKYTIKLEDSKQLHYRPVYNLGLIELEILKTYIETHLKTRFICFLSLLQVLLYYLIRT